MRTYRELESKPLIFLCSPICRYDNAANNRIIADEIIPMLARVAASEGCVFVNLYEQTTGQPQYFADIVHPNDRGYEWFGELVYRELMAFAKGESVV